MIPAQLKKMLVLRHKQHHGLVPRRGGALKLAGEGTITKLSGKALKELIKMLAVAGAGVALTAGTELLSAYLKDGVIYLVGKGLEHFAGAGAGGCRGRGQAGSGPFSAVPIGITPQAARITFKKGQRALTPANKRQLQMLTTKKLTSKDYADMAKYLMLHQKAQKGGAGTSQAGGAGTSQAGGAGVSQAGGGLFDPFVNVVKKAAKAVAKTVKKVGKSIVEVAEDVGQAVVKGAKAAGKETTRFLEGKTAFKPSHLLSGLSGAAVLASMGFPLAAPFLMPASRVLGVASTVARVSGRGKGKIFKFALPPAVMPISALKVLLTGPAIAVGRRLAGKGKKKDLVELWHKGKRWLLPAAAIAAAIAAYSSSSGKFNPYEDKSGVFATGPLWRGGMDMSGGGKKMARFLYLGKKYTIPAVLLAALVTGSVVNASDDLHDKVFGPGQVHGMGKKWKFVGKSALAVLLAYLAKQAVVGTVTGIQAGLADNAAQRALSGGSLKSMAKKFVNNLPAIAVASWTAATVGAAIYGGLQGHFSQQHADDIAAARAREVLANVNRPTRRGQFTVAEAAIDILKGIAGLAKGSGAFNLSGGCTVGKCPEFGLPAGFPKGRGKRPVGHIEGGARSKKCLAQQKQGIRILCPDLPWINEDGELPEPSAHSKKFGDCVAKTNTQAGLKSCLEGGRLFQNPLDKLTEKYIEKGFNALKKKVDKAKAKKGRGVNLAGQTRCGRGRGRGHGPGGIPMRGSREEVMAGLAVKTAGGLKKGDLKLNPKGKIVSRRKSAMAKRAR